MQNKRRAFFPIAVFFLLLNALIVVFKNLLEKWGMDQFVLIIGNLILFIATTISFFISIKGLKSSNPHAFVRSVYSSVMLKFFVFAIAAFIYIQVAKASVNKSALFTCMGLYLVYTFLEVSVLTKLLRNKANA
jgi:ACR3 family arsenite efflux pump ArsB